MARDRLAAMRAQQQSGVGSHSYPTQASGDRRNQYYEMDNVNSNTHLASGTPQPGDMSAFYTEISSIQDALRTFNDNVTRIGSLHSSSLNNMDDAAAQRNTTQLDGLVEDTSALSASLKKRIKALEAQRGSGRDGQIRQQQTALVKSKFVEAIQNYQIIEQQYRVKYKERLARQYKIVKPEATPDEVAAAVNNEEGGQIFAQALLKKSAYQEVQERHEDIKRIEQTLGELAQLFNDMSVLVEGQDDTINHIEAEARGVADNTVAGLIYTDKAVISARAARKKRWICFFIIVIVLAVIAIILGIVIGRQHK